MVNKESGLGLVYCCCIPACICSQARDYQLSGSVFTKLGLILSDEDVSRPYTAQPVPATPASTRCYTLRALLFADLPRFTTSMIFYIIYLFLYLMIHFTFGYILKEDC